MARGPSKKPSATATKGVSTPRPLLTPVGWSDSAEPRTYIEALLTQAGRHLGSRGLVPLHAEPLEELLRWRDNFPNAAHALLHNWESLNTPELVRRTVERRAAGYRAAARPRITLRLEITSKDNLTGRWYPTGFLEGRAQGLRSGARNTGNLIDMYEYENPLDFQWFAGDEPSTRTGRATNELMFIKGVGKLHRDSRPPRYPEPYSFYVASEMLICAVRATFNALVRSLQLRVRGGAERGLRFRHHRRAGPGRVVSANPRHGLADRRRTP